MTWPTRKPIPLEKRRADLAGWRRTSGCACDGGAPAFPVNRELQAVIAQYHLPFAHFDELIRGVEMDLDIKRYQTYEELEQYCYRVASVVGLLSVEIFGYQNPACRDYAIYLGKALQLTNILRDVRNDAERGRIYLPLEELARQKVSSEEILASEYSESLRAGRSERGRAGQEFLLAGGEDTSGRGPAFHDRGRIDGLGLRAVAASTGAQAL